MFAITFFVASGLELADIIEALKFFGKLSEMTWETYENSSIKTGEHTVYINLHENINPEDIPKKIVVGGYDVVLRHRGNIVCEKC